MFSSEYFFLLIISFLGFPPPPHYVVSLFHAKSIPLIFDSINIVWSTGQCGLQNLKFSFKDEERPYWIITIVAMFRFPFGTGQILCIWVLLAKTIRDLSDKSCWSWGWNISYSSFCGLISSPPLDRQQSSNRKWWRVMADLEASWVTLTMLWPWSSFLMSTVTWHFQSLFPLMNLHQWSSLTHCQDFDIIASCLNEFSNNDGFD